MAFDVGVWQKTRIRDAEGSGVAKAIKQFDKDWPENTAKLNKNTHDAGAAAVVALREALATAEGKCDRAKKPDPKKLAATKKLIKDWRADLVAFDDWLTSTFRKKQIEQVAARVAQTLGGNVPGAIEEITGKIDGFEKALKAFNLKECYKFQTDASKSLRVLTDQLTPRGVKEQIGYASRDLGVDGGLAGVKECTPDAFPRWKQELARLDQRFEALEPELDQLEQHDPGEDPEQAPGSPEYKKNLKEVIADYKSVTKVCEDTNKLLLVLLGRARQLEAMPPQARAAKQQVFQAAAKKIAELTDRAEAGMKTEVEKIRTSAGAYTKKKQEMGITKDDEIRYLAPLLNQMFAKNLRAIKTIGTIRHGLDRLEED